MKIGLTRISRKWPCTFLNHKSLLNNTKEPQKLVIRWFNKQRREITLYSRLYYLRKKKTFCLEQKGGPKTCPLKTIWSFLRPTFQGKYLRYPVRYWQKMQNIPIPTLSKPLPLPLRMKYQMGFICFTAKSLKLSPPPPLQGIYLGLSLQLRH